MKTIRNILLGLGIFAANLTLAQETPNIDWNSASDLQVELQALEQVPPTPADDATNGTTFYSAQHAPGTAEPWPPLPGNVLGLSAWDLGDGNYLLDDLDYNYHHRHRVQSQSVSDLSSGMTMSADDVPSLPGDGGDDDTNSTDDYFPLLSGATPINTNELWLQITNIAEGTAFLNLYNATDYVYAIWSITNLSPTLTNWQVETEVFSSNTNCMPFTVQTQGRTNLFLDAEDWTGVEMNGLPSWWTWLYFGNLNESATNMDSEGNSLGYDYTNNIDPNSVSFLINLTNNYVNSSFVPAQLAVSGVPYYIAISVDDTNYANDAVWNVYNSTNITIPLGAIGGWHNIWVGLRGHADSPSEATWQWSQLNLTPLPLVAITNPTSYVVDEPIIQIYGNCQEPLANICYDISNAGGTVTNLPSEITGQYFDTNMLNFTTNYFECLDVGLTNGTNIITVHATDLVGDTTTTNFDFILDYSSKTNPPGLQVTWPQNGTQISGSTFTCIGTIGDPTATVSTQVIFTNSNTNYFYDGIYTNTYIGSVDRNGNFWLENLPLNAGTNTFTITVTDVVGNMSVTNITVLQSALVLTVNPVSGTLWQPTVNLTGTISDPTYAIWVNGVKGVNNGNGTWSANNVPVNDGGTANFTAIAYAPSEEQPDGSYGNP